MEEINGTKFLLTKVVSRFVRVHQIPKSLNTHTQHIIVKSLSTLQLNAKIAKKKIPKVPQRKKKRGHLKREFKKK